MLNASNYLIKTQEFQVLQNQLMVCMCLLFRGTELTVTVFVQRDTPRRSPRDDAEDSKSVDRVNLETQLYVPLVGRCWRPAGI